MPKKEIIFSGRPDSNERSLEDKLEELVAGLFYISESDFPVEVFVGEAADDHSKEELLKQAWHDSGDEIEEIPFSVFFEKLTTVRDWYGDELKERSVKFANLEQELESALEDARVFRIGKIQIEIYVVGVDKKSGKLMGIKTKAIET